MCVCVCVFNFGGIPKIVAIQTLLPICSRGASSYTVHSVEYNLTVNQWNKILGLENDLHTVCLRSGCSTNGSNPLVGVVASLWCKSKST